MDTFCKQKPSFLIGKLKPDGGIELSQPIVYNGLFAKHTLYGSKTASHPSKLVKTQWKGGGYFTSLVTGENGVNYMKKKNVNISLKSIFITYLDPLISWKEDCFLNELPDVCAFFLVSMS